MWSTLYSCSILMKLEISQQIFIKTSNVKFHENPSSGCRVVPCGRTDRHNEANSRFSQFYEKHLKTEILKAFLSLTVYEFLSPNVITSLTQVYTKRTNLLHVFLSRDGLKFGVRSQEITGRVLSPLRNFYCWSWWITRVLQSFIDKCSRKWLIVSKLMSDGSFPQHACWVKSFKKWQPSKWRYCYVNRQ